MSVENEIFIEACRNGQTAYWDRTNGKRGSVVLVRSEARKFTTEAIRRGIMPEKDVSRCEAYPEIEKEIRAERQKRLAAEQAELEKEAAALCCSEQPGEQ